MVDTLRSLLVVVNHRAEAESVAAHLAPFSLDRHRRRHRHFRRHRRHRGQFLRHRHGIGVGDDLSVLHPSIPFLHY